MKSFLLVLGLVLASVCLLSAQRLSTSPAAPNTEAASPAPPAQAPEDVTTKITGLVNAGKYAEAQQLTTGLLLAYPNDQRLLKANALLDKLLATAGFAPGSNQPTNNAASAQHATNTNAQSLTGMDRVDYNALIELARQAQQTTDLSQQKTLLQQFMDQSSLFLQRYPDELLLWQLRAASALSLDDMLAGYDAGQKLLAMGAADSNDPNLQQLISQLKLKGWLDRQKGEAAKKNTADSLVNILSMKFVRVPRTTVLFSIWNTRVQDFQAFVDETHYDATQGMKSFVEYQRPKNILNLFDNGVPAHFEQHGNSWQSPGWPQLPEDPVTGVSWDDAVAFCHWLTEKERHSGKIRSDQAYRLPTDAEWSMAVEVGVEEEKGDTPKSKSYRVKKPISPLGNRVPNTYGIFDLGGKFWQLCEDSYDGKTTSKVGRGGPAYIVSLRYAIDPAERRNDGTFRVVLADHTQNQKDTP